MSKTTYIIRLKKDQVKDINDLEEIKRILQNDMGLELGNKLIKTTNSENIYRINKMNKKKVGKTKKNKIDQLCELCNENIDVGTFMKILDCSHIFHKSCINKYFDNHIYLECPTCNHEHITSYI